MEEFIFGVDCIYFRGIHSKKALYKCEDCNKKFFRYDKYRHHLALKHSGTCSYLIISYSRSRLQRIQLRASLFCIKTIDSNVKKLSYDEHLLPPNSFYCINLFIVSITQCMSSQASSNGFGFKLEIPATSL